MYACDGIWWDQYIEDVRKTFKGELWTQDKKAANDYGLKYIESLAGNGFCTGEFKIKQGQNSGYQAINLAYHFGAKRVILLGYDMCVDGNKRRWHKDHPSPCGNSSTYGEFVKNFDQMNPPIEVINCSRHTAIKAFPRKDLKSVLAYAK